VQHLRELGQNFLIDSAVAADIAAAADIQPGEQVWEIGPGEGILTAELLRFQPRLTAFELDRRLIPFLRERFGSYINLVHGDILRQDWERLTGGSDSDPTNPNPGGGHNSDPSTPPKIKLVSNLPYQITSPLLELLQRYQRRFSVVVLMLQKEVAQRLEAVPGSKAYGALTLRMRPTYDIETILQVPRHLFNPVPQVDSTVLRFKPRANPPSINNPRIFQHLIRLGFASRRKTLRNNLRPVYDLARLDRLEAQSGISLTRRAETLSEAEFINLSDLL